MLQQKQQQQPNTVYKSFVSALIHRVQHSKLQHTIGCNPGLQNTTQTASSAQALWRGSSVRLCSGRRKADMRSRLRQAALKAAHSPHRQLGCQTKAALQQLAAAKQLPQALPALATLSMCSQYSKGCCRMVAGAPSNHTALIG